MVRRFSFVSSIPDETTVRRFRNFLIDKDLYRKLLDRINPQLEEMELLVKKGGVDWATEILRP